MLAFCCFSYCDEAKAQLAVSGCDLSFGTTSVQVAAGAYQASSARAGTDSNTAGSAGGAPHVVDITHEEL